MSGLSVLNCLADKWLKSKQQIVRIMENDFKFVAPVNLHRVVSKEQWQKEHKEYLNEAKEFTRLYDKQVAMRKQLPWLKVEKEYVFEGPQGNVSLSDLFEGRNQLVIQHFMYGPEDTDGCVGCSFSADHVDAARMHFEHNDLSFAAISRAPLGNFTGYKARMGWNFTWVSSFANDFNYDFHVSFRKEDLNDGKGYYNFEWCEMDGGEAPGTSVFYKDESGNIYHTYSCYGRGGELLIGAYNFLDITPKGRNENGPNGNLTDWVRHHDKYDNGGYVDHLGHYHEASAAASCCSTPATKS